MTKDITKVKTKSGFECELSTKRLDNYELLELIGEVDENPLLLTKILKMLLSEKDINNLKEHLRNEDGIVPIEKMMEEIQDVFQSKDELKNS